MRFTKFVLVLFSVLVPVFSQVVPSGAGTVQSISTGCGLSGGPVTTTGTVTRAVATNAQTGTTYTLVAGDCGLVVTLTNAAAIALTVPAAGGSFPAGWFVDVQASGAGTVTCSGATCTLTTGQSARLISTGSTWLVLTGGGGSGVGGSSRYGTNAALPVTCTTGDLYTPSDKVWRYVCTATNTWTAFYDGVAVTPPAAADFTYLNNPSTTSTITDTAGGVRLTKGNQNNWVLAVHNTAAPATPWTVEMAVQTLSKGGANFSNFALALLEATTGAPKFECLGLVQTGGTPGYAGFTEFGKFNSPSSFNSAYTSDNQFVGSPNAYWIRITNDGANIVGYISRNGIDYAQHSTHTSTSFLSTVAGFGFQVSNDNGPSSPNVNNDTYSIFHYRVY